VARAAADRPLWNPGSDAPKWLDGSLPGDYGFDPLGLGSDPDALKYFVQAELVHGRFAMLGAAGIVLPGLATKAGVLNVPEWYDAGLVSIQKSGIPLAALISVQLLLFGWVEGKRYQDFKNPGSQGDGTFLGITDGFKGTGNGYPGGFFDPMNMSSPEMKQKEIKNGRLAMLACVGFVSQHACYPGKGPIDNLFDHMANPGMVCESAIDCRCSAEKCRRSVFALGSM
jgi:light-harvesting complex I chlorophyll a/b binding protein 5